jgi:hypothetical protein
LRVDKKVIRCYLSHLRTKGEFSKGRGATNCLNLHNLREMLKHGEEGRMLSKFFVNRHGMPWSDVEKDFVEDTNGVKDRAEKAQLLGRTEIGVRRIEYERGLDYALDSGYWTLKDVASHLGFSAGLGGMLRRHLKNKKLIPLDGTGHSKKHLDVPANKLRYVVRDTVKGGKDVPAKSIRQFFKLTKFKKLLFEESEIERFVRDLYPTRELECILCSSKSTGSLFCSRCSNSSLFPYSAEVVEVTYFEEPIPPSGCCFESQ